jgi:hypothetical protein
VRNLFAGVSCDCDIDSTSTAQGCNAQLHPWVEMKSISSTHEGLTAIQIIRHTSSLALVRSEYSSSKSRNGMAMSRMDSES